LGWAAVLALLPQLPDEICTVEKDFAFGQMRSLCVVNVHGVDLDEVACEGSWSPQSQFKLVQGALSKNFAVYQYKKRLFPG